MRAFARCSISLTLCAPAALSGCGATRPYGAPPQAQAALAPIPGVDGPIRFWGDGDADAISAMALAAFAAEEAQIKKAGHTGPLPPASYLAISGGGENGAFGAGLLCGWTAHGDRPDFKLVTGVSTGALTAPLAFLGPEQDATLKRFYTTVTGAQIARKRGLLSILTGDAAADTAPLASLIAEIVDEAFLHRVAEERAKGRLLLIGTTDLDAGRPVLWDMGAIAQRGGPEALALFRKVMLASASIPAVFPPQYIEILVDGRRYDEMHVDGGVTEQVFIYPANLKLHDIFEREHEDREHRAYILRNGLIDAEWAAIRPRALAIAGRSVTELIRTQGEGDLYVIYLDALRDELDYNLAFIPASLPFPRATAPFDKVYMTNLFDYAFNLAKKGYPWDKAPPGFSPGEIQRSPAK